MALVPPPTPRVVLVGGGYTLTRVAALLAAGSFVITSRDEATCQGWRAKGWLSKRVLITDKASVEELFREYPGVSVVVDSVPPIRSGDPVAGIKTLLAALPGSVTRLLYLSTTGVFGVRDGSVVSEETPPAPWNPQGEARLLSERAYQKHTLDHPARHFTALRLPAIYGPDRGVAESIRAGRYSLVGDGSQWTNRIHVDDLASVIRLCIDYKGVLPPVLCVSDDEPARARDVVDYICQREKLPVPDSVSEEEVERQGGYTMLSNQRVKNELMKKVLGVSLRYPTFREGIYSQKTDRV